MADLPSGTVTFLFTDIEGSTRMIRELGRDYEAVLAEHERLLTESFVAHGGRVVDTQGDSFFVVFARAADAVASATEAQKALAGHAWPEGVRVSVRMGLHSGEPRASGERLIGFGVHRAARIGAAGHGGQILLSNATRELLLDELPPETSLRDLGEFELKDLDRPERLYQVEADALRSDFPPLKAQQVAQPRSFFRRPVTIGVLAGVVLLAVAPAAFVFARGDSKPTVVANSLVKIDPATNEIVDVIEVGADPGQVEVVGKYVFVTGQEDGTLSRLDTATGQLETSGRFDATGSISGEGESLLWLASVTRDEVTQLLTESLAAIDRVPLPVEDNLLQSFVQTGGGSLWVSEWLVPPVVTRWDLSTLELVRTYRLPDTEFPLQIGYGAGAAWVSLSEGDALLRIDAKDGQETEVKVGDVPRDPQFGFGSVWAAMGAEGTVWRVDPRTERARAIVKVGKGPWGVAIGDGAVWVSNHCEGTVSRIDPATDQEFVKIETGFHPQWLAAGNGYVWVGVSERQGAQGLFLEECL